MRRVISTVVAMALLLGGLWLCWEWFSAPGHGDAGRKVTGMLFWIGPFMAIVGGLWLASDWLDL